MKLYAWKTYPRPPSPASPLKPFLLWKNWLSCTSRGNHVLSLYPCSFVEEPLIPVTLPRNGEKDLVFT